MKFCFSILLSLFFCGHAKAQTIYYQDIFHGGVTGDGVGPFVAEETFTFNVDIYPNSTIKSAFLFVTTYKLKPSSLDSSFQNRKIIFNNNEITLKECMTISNFHSTVYNQIIEKGVIAIDVSNMISLSQNNYTIIPAQNQNPTTLAGVYSEYYLYIAYKNTTLSKVNPVIVLNEQDNDLIINYNINNLNSIDLGSDVGFTFHATEFCDTLRDGSYVFVDGNLLGLTGGNEPPPNRNCTGVWGSFYYNNGTVYGLANDVPNNTMAGTDALANIQSYINNPNSLDVTFEYQDPTHGPYSNSVMQLFLTYTTPCDTFTTTLTSDTTICYGETLQLQATGGVSTGSISAYEWTSISNPSAIDDLSCADCPNPIFSGDSSMTYTVRIWNTDSCSVVRPVRINVNQPQKLNSYSGESKCGFSNGFIKSINLPDNLDAWYVVTPNNDTLDQPIGNTFTNLGACDYSVFYIDTIGCKSEDTIVTINSYIDVIADFTVNPSTGSAPLTVKIENQSQNASGLEWFLDGVSIGSTPPNLFELSGEYEIGLIAWDAKKYCADTTWRKIIVYDSLIAQIPNVFTANKDGINDFFGITVNFPVETELMILNRWGNVVFEWKGKLEKGQNNLWNGESKNGDKVSDGVYFYRIEFSQMEWVEKERKVSGYVHVINN